MQNSRSRRELQILRTQSGMLRNPGQHPRLDFYRIVKRPNVIAPLGVRQNHVRASL